MVEQVDEQQVAMAVHLVAVQIPVQEKLEVATLEYEASAQQQDAAEKQHQLVTEKLLSDQDVP